MTSVVEYLRQWGWDSYLFLLILMLITVEMIVMLRSA